MADFEAEKMARYPVLRGLYELDKTIGCGGFAKVKLATHILTGEKVAIKIMDKRSLGENLHRVRVELDALQTLSHHHISQLYQVLETESHFFLVVEYCSGGELFDHIVEKNRLSEKEARAAFRQIVSAVAYLHSLGFVHRDLKPENVLLDKDLNMKLIDFGLCAKPNGGLKGFLYTSCGSPTYAAPELVLGKKYLGHEVDVWSMGVLLYALLCGFLPFDDDKIDTLYKKILDGKYEEPSWLTMESRRLIRSMLQIDPKKRIRVDELLNHPWVMRGFREPVCVNNSSNMKEYDIQCVGLLARQRNVSPEDMWELLSKWKYDYNTATYFLMLNRKRRGLPVRLFGPGATPFRNYRNNTPVASAFDMQRTQQDSISGRTLTTPIKRPIADDSTPVVPDKRERSALTPVNEEAHSHSNYTNAPITRHQKQINQVCKTPAKPPELPSATSNGKRKLNKRLHSPGPDESPLSPRRTRREQQQQSGKATQQGTPAACTPTPATPDRSEPTAARGLLGSIERSLHRVRHILTPRRKMDAMQEEGASPLQRPATPAVLSAKGLCNVSTASRSDPDEVLQELRRALSSKGITCKQKGFTLRGRVDAEKGHQMSFELEVCLIQTCAPNIRNPPAPLVGIRRKRLKGDAWCYKRVCEEVLALAQQSG
ncbi:maternal embryonic leucine zipper kinase-like isoform X2 [Thrips palmi]|uniref:non-specific serine/threonine protein kinase n=1 Tax=Thrips palmi TaxID=161013 RepID=A0A6P8ZPQ0_THRPL|nr:maternal embryonic leucine zipper kinase-like isoform X2 [Thrips palmi]